MSRDASPPVVLIAHGTRDERGRDELRALARATAHGYGARVRVGVIEYPSYGLQPVFAALGDAAGDARASGAGEVRLVPLLLFPAGHARDDMRVIVRGAARLHPDVRWRCMPLLRPAPPLLAALGARIAEAEARSGLRAEAIVVAGRGSSSEHANHRLPAIVCRRLHRLDGRPVVHAFASLAPPSTGGALETLYGQGVRSAVVAPYLLNAGRIADRIGEQACEFAAAHPDFRLVLADHLGLHPALTAYVRARVHGVRGTSARLPGGENTTLTPLYVRHEPPAGKSAVMPYAVSAAARHPHPRPIVVAGTASGTGKTTLALGLMAALRRRGMRVQPFKVGPDFIDPLHHSAVAGRISRNLDSVICDPRTVPALAARAMSGADVAVVEGVLGLYDGRLGDGDRGSTAEVARLLDADVVLVVDAARSARSTGAVALGFARFDPRVRISGVVLNRVGSERHEQAAREAVEAAGLRVLGAIPRDPSLTLPERYLGLVPPQERAHAPRWVEALAACIDRHVDVDALLRVAAQPGGPVADPDHDPFALPRLAPRARIAVARDAAFTFHYQDALDLLQLRGAELVPFSPLVDSALPGCGAAILPGGFPERFASVLRDNVAMRRSLAAAVRGGMPVVAECGGAMYLGAGIAQEDGERFEMCGVLPYGTRMARTRRALGYRTARALRDSPLLRAGETVRGHEFHWSFTDPGIDAGSAAYRVAETDAVEGHASPSILASYVHLHLCGVPGGAARLVAAAERYERRPVSGAATVPGSGGAQHAAGFATAQGRPRGGVST
ncbi:MAG TPA: cobyrinate a,c-diamide synthase [Candidatus Dormibacteraeota bacterium]|jgi:cobyrinic acid a,c-diamide synthase|nr:cobyrinate a,c-diamide synthase [Candidatus Dormibacteraeota bacterium]